MSDLMVDPVEPTDVDTSQGGEDPGASSETPVLDLDEFADFSIPVKINGEEQLVPIREAISGYSRTEDYTRKTQALAAEREQIAQAAALQAALEEDPAATLAVLQAIYGRETEQQPDPTEDMEPWERDLAEVKQRFAQLDEQAAMQAMEQQLLAIQQADGTDPNELLKFAAEREIPNIEWAHAVYLTTLTPEQRAANLAQVKPQTERTTTKAEDAFIAPGSGASVDGTQPSTEPPRDPREAALRAMSSLGMV